MLIWKAPRFRKFRIDLLDDLNFDIKIPYEFRTVILKKLIEVEA